MDEENTDRISKLRPYKTQNPTRSFVNDGDLQINLPASKDSVNVQNLETFKNIYAHYKSLLAKASKGDPSLKVIQEVQEAMEEAKLNYDMMMDISNAISEAYKDLKNLK